jgi:ribonuclease HI
MNIFTDGSVNPQSNIGWGAYLAVDNCDASMEILESQIKVKRFEPTTSTKLELQTVLWALTDSKERINCTIYTDCQNVVQLPQRRKKLEDKNYRSNRQKKFSNHELYKEFFLILDSLDFTLIKVMGHKSSAKKNKMDQIFSLVDKAARKALRKDLRNSSDDKA